jgi:mono/diheme cytochrome c family protein
LRQRMTGVHVPSREPKRDGARRARARKGCHVMAFRKLLYVVPVVAAALCASASASRAQTAASIARGQEIAERACGGCHALAGQPGRIIEGVAVPSFRAIAGRPNQTPQRLQSFIMTPHRPMPGIPLSLVEVNDVAAYILSLK